MSTEDLNKTESETLLEEIRSRFDYASDQWREIRDEGDKDMLCVAGEVWEALDPAGMAQRDAAMRPMITSDELGQYFNQIINDVRANPIAMKFDPTGDGANDKGAEFYADKAREIEYRSHAQIGYTTAFENTVQRSFGWVRVNTKRAHLKTRNQEIWIESVPDPNSIVPDPDFKRPDFSDGRYLFVIEQHDTKEFKRRWPKAKVTDFTGEIALQAPAWVKGSKVQVAEYWKIKTKTRKLGAWRLPDGREIEEFEDDLAAIPPGAVKIGESIDVEEPTVCQYITNGIEILETNEWAGKYIPFAACLGKVLYVTRGGLTKRMIMSMTRLARSPYMLLCYYRTQQAEMAGMMPKAPVQAYEGQMRGHETEWQKAAHEPVAFLYFKGTTEATGSQILPPPSRIDYNAGEHLQSLEMCAEGARRAIQAAMGGSPLPTQAQRQNQKSGVALRQVESSTQKGSFHFIDHYHDMIRQVGVMVEDLMDKIYDTARDVGTMQANEEAQTVSINGQPKVNTNGEIEQPISTKGTYNVTCSTGPSTESTRQAASDFADELVQNQQVFPLIASEVVKLKNLGPIGDRIADALEVLKPPELRKQKDGSPPLPPEAQAAMAENAQLKQQLQQASQAIETDQAKQQATIKKAEIDAQKDTQLAQLNAQIEQAKGQLQLQMQQMKDQTALQIAQLEAEMKRIELAQDAEIEAAKLEQQRVHDAHEADLAERQMTHQAAMAEHAARNAARPKSVKSMKRDEKGQVSEIHEEYVS